MGDMNRNISQNRIAILAVSQYVKNRNNIESWPKYRNTIESSHFCQFPPPVCMCVCVCVFVVLCVCWSVCVCVCVCVFVFLRFAEIQYLLKDPVLVNLINLTPLN